MGGNLIAGFSINLIISEGLQYFLIINIYIEVCEIVEYNEIVKKSLISDMEFCIQILYHFFKIAHG
jgi:hypothetical protein